MALGPFKALVHTEACLLFEAGKMDVSHIAPILADLVAANNQARGGGEGGRGGVRPHQARIAKRALYSFYHWS